MRLTGFDLDGGGGEVGGGAGGEGGVHGAGVGGVVGREDRRGERAVRGQRLVRVVQLVTVGPVRNILTDSLRTPGRSVVRPPHCPRNGCCYLVPVVKCCVGVR